jgi:hypothetical protein
MPSLTAQLPGPHWEPTTPTQKFFKAYVNAVDNKGYDIGSGLKFYSKDVTFHNQNNAVYHGGEEMWAWMKKLFGIFDRISHDWIQFTEIEHDDGTTQFITQNVRNLWIKGNDGEKPTLSIPVVMIAIVGPSGDENTPEGLDFKEVWLYWDTALLLPKLPREAVVFKTKNVLNSE